MAHEEQDLAEKLNDALLAFTSCVGNSVEDVCSFGLTIGESYVPFNPDPDDGCENDDDEFLCSQLWVRVAGSNPTASSVESFAGQDCTLTMQMTLEVGIYRCIEIAGDGEAPTAEEVLVAGAQAMEDMKRIMCAALSCEVWDSIDVGAWSPTGPLGGQYGGIWTFTVVEK
jgi:hypothetical protein